MCSVLILWLTFGCVFPKYSNGINLPDPLNFFLWTHRWTKTVCHLSAISNSIFLKSESERMSKLFCLGADFGPILDIWGGEWNFMILAGGGTRPRRTLCPINSCLSVSPCVTFFPVNRSKDFSTLHVRDRWVGWRDRALFWEKFSFGQKWHFFGLWQKNGSKDFIDFVYGVRGDDYLTSFDRMSKKIWFSRYGPKTGQSGHRWHLIIAEHILFGLLIQFESFDLTVKWSKMVPIM